MYSILKKVSFAIALFIAQLANAGDFTADDLALKPLPSLKDRVNNAELIVRLRVEIRRHEAAGRIVEVLKGTYEPRNFPDDPKGFFAFGIPAGQFKMDHDEEIWILGKSKVLYAPADSQPDPEAVIFRPAKVYYDRLELPIRKGVVAFPIMGARHGGAIQTTNFKSSDFIADIRAILRNPSAK